MKKFFLSLVAIVIIFFLGSFVYNFSTDFNKLETFLKKNIPLPLKIYIKDNFLKSDIKSENLELKNQVYDLKKKVRMLENEYIDLESQFTGVETDYFNYKMNRYELPFHKAKNWGTKSVSYLEDYENKIILTTGNGGIFYLEKNLFLKKKQLRLQPIDSNLKKIVKDPAFWDLDEKVKVVLSKVDEKIAGRSGILGNMIGVTSILVNDGYFYIAYAKEIKKYCYHIGILRAKIDFKKMIFEDFLNYPNPKECARADILTKDYGFNGKVSGGKLSKYKDDKILLSIGTFGLMKNVFDDSHYFGKMIEIDTQSKNIKVLSKGHRNPQGLIYEKNINTIISTEHGPKGGDEINIIKEGKNYGWPDASYGIEYNPYLQEVGLKKNHKEFGYEEPIYYFTPSIGISDIIKIPSNFSDNLERNFFVASLTGSATYGNTQANKRYTNNKTAGRSMFRIRFNDMYTKIDEVERIYVGDRIRDMHYLKNENVFLLLLEEQSALAVFERF